MNQRSLFEKYGGFASLHSLVSAFYDEVLNSEIISFRFDSVDMPELIEHQTKFVAALMGGPGHYSDRLLAAAHGNLRIDEIEWDEVVRILTATLQKFRVEEDDIATLLGIIGSKKALIVAQP